MNDPNDLARLLRQQRNNDNLRGLIEIQQLSRLRQEQARAAEYQRQQLNLLRAHQGLPPIPSPQEVAEEERRAAEFERAARRDARHREIEATWPQDQRILWVAAGVLVLSALGRAWPLAGIAAVTTALYLWRVVTHLAWRRGAGASDEGPEVDVDPDAEAAGSEVERLEDEVVLDVAPGAHPPERTDRSPTPQRSEGRLLLEQTGRGDRRTRLFTVPAGATGFTVAWDCPEDGTNRVEVRRPPDDHVARVIYVFEPTCGESYFYEQGELFLDIDAPAWRVEVRGLW